MLHGCFEGGSTVQYQNESTGPWQCATLRLSVMWPHTTDTKKGGSLAMDLQDHMHMRIPPREPTSYWTSAMKDRHLHFDVHIRPS